MNTCDVIVVGAGMAGIAAARRLAQSGRSVIVPEASERVGGRVLTQRSSDPPLDLGAQWIHAAGGNPITLLAEELGVRNFSGQDRWFPDGYDEIPRRFSRGVDIRFKEPVYQISIGDHGAEVFTPRGNYSGAAVIVAVSLGVLKRGMIEFNPPLEQSKAAAVERLGMGVLDKTILCFRRRTWPEAGHLIRADAAPGMHQSFASFSRGGPSGFLVGWSGGRSAAALERMEESEIVESAFGTLQRMSGGFGERPYRTAVSRWGKNPYVRGSYSYSPVSSEFGDYDVLARPQGPLRFAGESTSRSYHGTVHGAYLSGLREADRICGGS